MKFLKWLGIIIILIVVLFLVIPIFLPSNFHIERDIVVDKPVDVVFESAVDMNMRSKWDPWIEMEPEAKVTVNVTPEIIGSGYTWKGEVIGEGKITIQEFVPNKVIKSEITFISPQSMKSDIIWSFEEIEGGTKIIWAFEGTLSYPMERWAGLFLDNSIGASFEQGLRNFKELVEELPEYKVTTGEIKEGYFEGLTAVTITEKCEMDKLSSKMIEMYTSLMRYIRENNEEIAGSPFAIYHPIEEEGTVLLECGLPVNAKLQGEEPINFITIPESKVLIASHFGHFKTVQKTHKKLKKYIAENNLEMAGTPWEMYITDPMKEPDQSKWETKVYFPIK